MTNRLQKDPFRFLTEPLSVRIMLIALAAFFIFIMIILPLIIVFVEAFRKGITYYTNAITDPFSLLAIKLTLVVVLIALPLNIIFGLSASWAITHFQFPGRNLLISLIELPLSISPVIGGFMYVLLFGAGSAIGGWLHAHDLSIVFAIPGIVLATIFESLPYIARELIPFMEEMGSEEEEAALSLGATGWQTFFKITLPNIKWALIYGALLSNARAMGGFGAVSIVSGHIQGLTNTIPLHVEILYNEYNFAAAFAMASLLVFMALLSLGIKIIFERKNKVILDEKVVQ